jgi:hypothetical protein
MKISNQRVIKAGSVGILASKILSKDQDARVFGKTSKGIFIKICDMWLVFLSFDHFRGPLTITLDEIEPSLQLVSDEAPLKINSQTIFLPNLAMTIIIDGSEVWQAPLPSSLPLSRSERQEKLVLFAEEILSVKNGVGLSYLIPPLLGLPKSQLRRKTLDGINKAYIHQLQREIRNGEAVRLSELLSSILGSGPGLTPSADDFCAGVLLTLNRWQKPRWNASNLKELNRRVVNIAYKITTMLSANLIECATLGLANERLVNALDWMITGVASKPKTVSHLLEWGNSSGIDAFTGMAVALTA